VFYFFFLNSGIKPEKPKKSNLNIHFHIEGYVKKRKQKTAVVLKIDEKGQPLSAAGYSNKCFSIFPDNELSCIGNLPNYKAMCNR
jgi:hypothetical protein